MEMEIVRKPTPEIKMMTNWPNFDDPAKHRWRAGWGWHTFYSGMVEPPPDIFLRAYPVMKITPCGVWISTKSYVGQVDFAADPEHDRYAWRIYDADDPSRWRWVSNDGAQAWAKPTREEAVHSIVIRLSRWAPLVSRDMRKVRGAAETVERLFGDRYKQQLKTVRSHVPEPL